MPTRVYVARPRCAILGNALMTRHAQMSILYELTLRGATDFLVDIANSNTIQVCSAH